MSRQWEIIADKLSKAGWSLGWVSAVDREGRTIWIVDAHRGDGKRFVVRSDEKLTAFLELESATRTGLLLKQEHATPWVTKTEDVGISRECSYRLRRWI